MDVELAALLRDHRMKQHLKQQVTKLFTHESGIPVAQRVVELL